MRGPLTAEQVRSLPGLAPETPVCPEGHDPARSRDWTAAASYPQLLAGLADDVPQGDGGAARFWKSAVAKERVAAALAAAAPREAGSGGTPLWLLAAMLPILVFGLLSLGGRGPRPAPPAPPRAAPRNLLEQAAPLLFPARLARDEGARLLGSAGLAFLGPRTEIVLPADGRLLKSEARFSYDPARRELRPTNEAARGLLDLRPPRRRL
ncbi:MAG: hypothetical protein HY926_15240 [Elusimicrobia bacterium]|nr:hypothetical protein [Elusimicrobiota bacterium]